MKKFFVDANWRSQKVSLALYQQLLAFAMQKHLEYIILDTPSVAQVSHKFYLQSGFRQITKEELPIAYIYPDWDSLLFMLHLTA